MKTRITLALATALILATVAVPASAFWVSDCPQKCTPSCPCSIPCQGPMGPTTCGQAGQACTGLIETVDPIPTSNMTPLRADSDEVFLLELQALEEPSSEMAEEPTAD